MSVCTKYCRGFLVKSENPFTSLSMVEDKQATRSNLSSALYFQFNNIIGNGATYCFLCKNLQLIFSYPT